MQIHEVAKLTGVTVRTLHYYDEIGLLCPQRVTQAGYRLYDQEALARLQQILFFRELDFPLKEIKAILSNPDYDKTEALQRQKVLLEKKRQRLDRLIDLVSASMKGDQTMEFQAFDQQELTQLRQKYAAEAKARWGETEAYAQYQARTAADDDAQWNQQNEEAHAIWAQFSAHRNDPPDSPALQALVAQWQAYISKHFYTCSNEILAGLGQMYVGDPRFTENIDRFGKGTADCMANAIAVYCQAD